MKGTKIPKDHKCWDLESYYLAFAVSQAVLMYSPEKIILGGGVMKQEHLFPKIRKKVIEILGNYIKVEEITHNIDSYIVYPVLGENAGICGGLALAIKEYKKWRKKNVPFKI